MLALPPGGATMRWVFLRGTLSSIWAPARSKIELGWSVCLNSKDDKLNTFMLLSFFICTSTWQRFQASLLRHLTHEISKDLISRPLANLSAWTKFSCVYMSFSWQSSEVWICERIWCKNEIGEARSLQNPFGEFHQCNTIIHCTPPPYNFSHLSTKLNPASHQYVVRESVCIRPCQINFTHKCLYRYALSWMTWMLLFMHLKIMLNVDLSIA